MQHIIWIEIRGLVEFAEYYTDLNKAIGRIC